MAQIVIAVDERGRRYRVTEEEAKKRGLKVITETATAQSKNKKRRSNQK